MIERFPPLPESQETRLLLRPNRSASPRQIRRFFLFLAVVCGATAVLAWTQGNVFAPGFALFYLLLVAACLYRVWRRSARGEVVAVSPDEVAVRRLPELAEAFSAHPRWVRIERAVSGVRLCSAGREVEIGAFLVPEERARLADSVGELLAEARARPARD